MLTRPVAHSVLWHSFAFSLLLTPNLALAKIETIQNGSEKTIKVRIDNVEFKNVSINGDAYLEAQLRGVEGHEGILTTGEGQPVLPVVRFVVPGNPQVRVYASFVDSGALSSDLKIKPAQPSLPKIAGAERRFAFDDQAYDRESLEPIQAYDLKPAGSVNGVPQTLVTLYPLSYAPGTQSYTMRKSFEISYEDQAFADKADLPERFVFVVGKNFERSPSLAAYAALKRELGFVVDQIVVDSRTSPETIRNRLKEMYAKSDAKLAYAMIVGDVEDVQSKNSDIISGLTDHFYRSLDTNDYASDINGPDIGVGRVSARNETQLAAILQKFTRYTLGTFSTDKWLNEISFLATNDQWQVAEGTHNYVINTHTKNKGYTGVFPEALQPGGDQLYSVTHRVSDDRVHDALGLGRTIIDYSGHGATTYWDAPYVDQDTVRNLKDPNALPFVIANACITGDFRESESFGETWQRHPFGAITYWGSMDSTYWDEDDILERKMFDGIFTADKRSFAEITHHALAETWAYFGGEGFANYYWETYVLFGDPSIQLRTTKVTGLTLLGPASVAVGTQSVSFTVKNTSGPVVGAAVALSQSGTTVAQKVTTDFMGRATLNLSMVSSKPTTVKVVAQGYNAALAKGMLEIK
jgi:hypothetical protein